MADDPTMRLYEVQMEIQETKNKLLDLKTKENQLNRILSHLRIKENQWIDAISSLDPFMASSFARISFTDEEQKASTSLQVAPLTVEKIQKEEKEVVSLHKKKFEMEQKWARYEADPTECDIANRSYNRNFMFCIREMELFNNSKLPISQQALTEIHKIGIHTIPKKRTEQQMNKRQKNYPRGMAKKNNIGVPQRKSYDF